MKTRHRMVNLLVLLLIAVAACASLTKAQTASRELLAEYIQRNGELLAEAAVLVRGTNSAKARTSLDAASQLHEASRKDFENERFLSAAALAQRARDAIQKAVQLAKRETKLEENAHRAIERAGRRNEQARTYYDEDRTQNNIPAKKLIDESLNQLMRARDSVREHMFEVAIQSANASYDMASRAIVLLKRETVGPELVRREIARTDRLLERIDERAAGSDLPGLDRLIDDAYLFQNRARADATEGRYILAFEHTKRAREIARRIINRAGSDAAPGPDTVTKTLDLTDTLLERAFEIARENGDDDAVRQLEEARQMQEDARDLFRKGQMDGAVTLSHRARDMARQTARSMHRDIDDTSARRALERTDAVLARLRDALDDAQTGTAADLFARASKRQREAWSAFDSGDFRKALANTKVARNLATNALRRLENGQLD